MSYRIVTDTCCDLPEQMYDELNLSVVRLGVNYKGQTTDTYTEDWLQAMFDGLRAGEVATTAAVNPTGWESVMEPVLQGGEDVLVLAFSSGLSTTYQSAVIAAEELKESIPTERSTWWIPSAPPWARACWSGMPAGSGTRAWTSIPLPHGWRKRRCTCATGSLWMT